MRDGLLKKYGLIIYLLAAISNQPTELSDGSCFLTAWVVSKSAFDTTHDRPKQKLPKRKGI